MTASENASRRWRWILGAGVALWLFWALITAPAVPFHPDESTYLYMSADGAAWLRHPLTLAYRGDGGLREHYRLVNAPLTRYLVALGLAVGGQPPLRADWDWSASWAANVARGAVPTRGQLTAARAVMVLCTALAAVFLALTAYRLAGSSAAVVTAAAFLLNPLVLLHGRRAMMEAPMLLGVAWVLWELTSERPSPWRLGAALGWAVWAKYWAVALVPVALWVVWRRRGEGPGRRWVVRLAAVLLVPLAMGLLLQPVLWRQPWRVLPEMAAARLQVTAKQRAAFKAVLPAYAPDTPWQRLAILGGQIYLAPPAYLDLGKYAAPLEAEIRAYDAHFWAHWSTVLPVAFLRLMAMLLGLWCMAVWARQRTRRGSAVRLVLAAAVFQWGLLLLTLPLAFQRYALAVFPWVVLWESIGAVETARWLAKQVRWFMPRTS